MIKAVFLKTCFSKFKADLYINELNSRGIYSFIANEASSDLLPWGGGGYELQVDADKLDEALTIIEEMDANYEAEENFHDATKEDIEYEKIKTEREEERNSGSWLTYFVMGVAIVLLLIVYVFRNKIL